MSANVIFHFLTFQFSELKMCKNRMGGKGNIFSSRVSHFISNDLKRYAKKSSTKFGIK